MFITYVPIIFAISVAIVSFILVIVGIYSLLVLTDFRNTLKRVNKNLDKNPEKIEILKTQIAVATQVDDGDKRIKKRTYVRKPDPRQFRGV